MRAAAGLIALATLQAGVSVPAVRAAHPPEPQTVRIDVLAGDARGRSIDTLKSADFEVRDDDAVQRIDTLRLVRPGPDDARLFAIYLDDYHVAAEAAERVKAAVSAFVDQLRPRDEVVVMRPLDSLFAIQLTTDRAAAHRAIDAFAGRKGEYDARNPYERNFMAGAPGRVEAARTQVALSAVNALAVHLAQTVDARKSLIVISDGIGRAERRRGLEYLPTLDTVIRSAVKGNVSIYPIATVDQAPDDRAAAALETLAAETSGQATFGDVAAGLQRAAADMNAYYWLTFTAARPTDGAFHAVHVTVRRPGTQLRARKGYFAPSPDDAIKAAVLERLNNPPPPVPVEPAPHASTLIRPWFGMTRGEDGRTRVTFVWEPAVRLTGDRIRRTPARIVLTAIAPDDSVLYDGVVLPTGPATKDEPGATPYRAVFEMQPGRLRLRMSIQDGASQVLDSDVRSISVRDLKSGVSIGTPEVLRARNAREFRALDDEDAVPVSSREFSRTERLLVRFRAYGPSGSSPAVSARLLSRLGGPMRDLPIALPNAREEGYEIDLPLAGLAAGEYAIEVSASASGSAAKDVVEFRVTT